MSTLSANALIFFDQTAITVALPTIAREFDAAAHELQWVITAYLLALAAFMPVVGQAADHFGRKTALLVGMLVFGIGSLACGRAYLAPPRSRPVRPGSRWGSPATAGAREHNSCHA